MSIRQESKPSALLAISTNERRKKFISIKVDLVRLTNSITFHISPMYTWINDKNIRRDYFIVTHKSLLLMKLVICSLFTLKNHDLRYSKLTRDHPTDGRTGGRTDTTSYRDAYSHLITDPANSFSKLPFSKSVFEHDGNGYPTYITWKPL